MDRSRNVIDLVAGSLCLFTGSLNAWNMAGVGVSGWRLTTVFVFFLIGLYLLFRYFTAQRKPDVSQDDI